MLWLQLIRVSKMGSWWSNGAGVLAPLQPGLLYQLIKDGVGIASETRPIISSRMYKIQINNRNTIPCI